MKDPLSGKFFFLQFILLLGVMPLTAQPLQNGDQPMSDTYKEALKLHQRGMYKEALDLYKKAQKEPSSSMGGLATVIANQIAYCEYGLKRKSDPEPVTVTKIEAEINGVTCSNINAFSSNSEQVLYFTSHRPDKVVGNSKPKPKAQLDRLYIGKRMGDSKQWEVKNIVGDKRFHESFLGIAPDGKEVFVFRGSGDVFLLDVVSDADAQSMTNGDRPSLVPMGKRYNLDIDKSHPISSLAINRDRTVIYLCMNDYREKGGYGGYDIWQTRYDKTTGLWGELTNLGPKINTEQDEISVSILPDGATLFFSSNGHKGLGKLDIYRTEFVDSLGSWNKPTHLGYPINTANNDIYYNPVPGNPRHAYYSCEREDGSGMYDIRFISYFGRILNEEEKDRLRLEYRKAIEDAKKELKKAKNDLKKQDIKLLEKKGYDDFPMDSVRVGMKVYLRNILFASGKATLLPESFKQLEQLYRLMVYHSTLQIEISGHTDNTGSKELNKRLSQERAQSVLDYLVGREIEPNRMKAKGFGYSQPIATNKTASGKKLNRRVEFKIVGIGYEVMVPVDTTTPAGQ